MKLDGVRQVFVGLVFLSGCEACADCRRIGIQMLGANKTHSVAQLWVVGWLYSGCIMALKLPSPLCKNLAVLWYWQHVLCVSPSMLRHGWAGSSR